MTEASAGPKGGKKGRKHGRNKLGCKAYALSNSAAQRKAKRNARHNARYGPVPTALKDRAYHAKRAAKAQRQYERAQDSGNDAARMKAGYYLEYYTA